MRFGFIVLLLLVFPKPTQAQFDVNDPMGAVTAFFEAFHKRDLTGLETAFSKQATLGSTRLDQKGNSQFGTSPISDFITAVVQRPDTPVWEEKLGVETVLLDFPMAQVWVAYEFFLDGNFSHCGINNFTLVWQDQRWKIVQLIDTRHTACSE